MNDGKIVPKSGKFFASATERTQSRKGIQQEIIGRVQCKLAYEVTTLVRIFGNNVSTADVRATLWVQTPNLREQYIGIAKAVYWLLVGDSEDSFWKGHDEGVHIGMGTRYKEMAIINKKQGVLVPFRETKANSNFGQPPILD
ncbi:hypothetical protein JHK82_035186 [Glycine max]|nr:hypothetical protein JHK85_035907 [Glycine max]KAG5111917.1 hypothetical protein JHK82_035186 [Glycine max]